jgi:large exoprotein involved in heme utilization and adhesion
MGEVGTVSKKIRLVIDSVVDDLARISLSSENNRTTLNVNADSLRAILGRNSIEEGKTYLLTLDDLEDYKDVWSGTFDNSYQFHGNKKIEDTTEQDLKTIRKRLKRLRRLR